MRHPDGPSIARLLPELTDGLVAHREAVGHRDVVVMDPALMLSDLRDGAKLDPTIEADGQAPEEPRADPLMVGVREIGVHRESDHIDPEGGGELAEAASHDLGFLLAPC